MTAASPSYPTFSGAGAERLRSGPWRIVVVGASGWLGLATLEMLHGLFGGDFHRRVACFGSSGRVLNLRGGRVAEQQPLARLIDLPPMPSLVLHMAYLTQEKAKGMSEADYAAANRTISGQVLGSLDAIGAQGMFLPSSGAVYMADQADAEPSKRLYGALKREDEDRFGEWAEARCRRAVIARVFNVSGPYINKRSSYALACFVADALAGRPIVIRATRPVFRSFVAIEEMMSIVAGELTEPGAGRALFDTAGDEILEMSEIALRVAEVLGNSRGIERGALEGPPDRYVGEGDAYARLRGCNGVTPVGFHRQIRETARFMADFPADLP